MPSESPRKRLDSLSFGPRSSPNLLPRDLTSNHDRARFPPSSSSGFQSSNTPPSRPGQGSSHLSVKSQARKRPFTESNPPPRKKVIQSGENYCPPYKSVKTLGDAMSEVPFSPAKLPYMKTGCGSTLLRDVEAFSGPSKNERNLALSAKIDKDSSSCRAPFEVMKGVMVDRDWSDRVEEKIIKDLSVKAERLKELMPSCSCLVGASEPSPYYVHLGHAKTFKEMRKLFKARMQPKGG